MDLAVIQFHLKIWNEPNIVVLNMYMIAVRQLLLFSIRWVFWYELRDWSTVFLSYKYDSLYSFEKIVKGSIKNVQKQFRMRRYIHTHKRARAHTFAGWLDVQVLEYVQMLFLFVTKVSYCYKNYQIVIHCARYVMAIVYEYDVCSLLMVLTYTLSLSLSPHDTASHCTLAFYSFRFGLFFSFRQPVCG